MTLEPLFNLKIREYKVEEELKEPYLVVIDTLSEDKKTFKFDTLKIDYAYWFFYYNGVEVYKLPNDRNSVLNFINGQESGDMSQKIVRLVHLNGEPVIY